MVKYERIKPADTYADPRYQRDYDEKRAAAMAADWRPELLGVPVISRRADGVLARVDAQHRLGALISAGLGHVPVLMEVHDGLSLQDEAELFLRLNGGRSAVRAFDKFKARLIAHEPVALEIRDTLKKVGLEISKQKRRFGVQAIQAVEYAYHRGTLLKTMRVLGDWLEGDPEAFECIIIRGLSTLLAGDHAVDSDVLLGKLRPIPAERVKSAIQRECGRSGDTSARSGERVFRELYERKTRGGKKAA